ncbi:inosine-uridine nucleoside hydrolase [Alkalihalophilus pseudofirmus OF4]|uniref:Inosine-uridine nucleoside hydrolase n=1 Tax=Alkalihalophilus pseudofirmus (strain ATCC BAA-2126 / JCM 17055 / OF4) TaxID=398511 RepID=D3FSJ7_ALKPO|nr:nucleoside hydrolase [Alkalihalophilus pseudofirmus]ADC49965.1 inosine-uridine nucleoside hydrolase [Alkalihalophilus pseudofirmus OF4]
MEKVLLFCDPGIDDSVAIMFALLHPDIEVVGIVSSYGNVDKEQATNNAAYLLDLAGRLDVPLIGAAAYPLSGEMAVYYPEIHGEEGLGPITPPDTISGTLENFSRVFSIIDEYEGELVIVDVGRQTSLASAFILGEDVMDKVKAFYVMGGAFLVPGNVTPLAEANFFGDPIAANVVATRAHSLTIVPLNVTNYAILTDEVIDQITDQEYNTFTPLIRPIYDYYAEAYQELVLGIEGAPFHDVVTLVALTNPELFDFVEREVTVVDDPSVRGLSVADFRPLSAEEEASIEGAQIAMDFNYDEYINIFIQVMKMEF